MYRPVIIYCLIIVGWMGTVSAVYFKNNREARQANVNYVQPAAQSAAQPATQPAAQSPAQPHVQSTSTPYPYVTYPEYSQTTSSSNPTVTAVTVPSSSTESFFHSLAPYTRTVIEFSTKAGNVLFQAMGIAFIGQTILGIFCSFTPICRSLLSGSRSFDEMYVQPEYLNEFTPVITKVIDVFSDMQEEIKNKEEKVKE